MGKGIILAFPYDVISESFPLTIGTPTEFVIPLREDLGWVKDPQNRVLPWKESSKCDMIQVYLIYIVANKYVEDKYVCLFLGFIPIVADSYSWRLDPMV